MRATTRCANLWPLAPISEPCSSATQTPETTAPPCRQESRNCRVWRYPEQFAFCLSSPQPVPARTVCAAPLQQTTCAGLPPRLSDPPLWKPRTTQGRSAPGSATRQLADRRLQTRDLRRSGAGTPGPLFYAGNSGLECLLAAGLACSYWCGMSRVTYRSVSAMVAYSLAADPQPW